MDRNLMDYLPPVLREVLEFQAINQANAPEISAGWDALDRVLANQFLETADALGVAVWEKELHLLPKDTDTLDTRKTRIRARWNMELPYSLLWLRQWLSSLFGPGGHETCLDHYTLHVLLHYDLLAPADSRTAEVIETLHTALPANLLLQVSNVYQPVPFVSAPGRLRFQTLKIPLRISNYAGDMIQLNGQRRLDGSWPLNQAMRGVALVQTGIHLHLNTKPVVSEVFALTCALPAVRPSAKLKQFTVPLAAASPSRAALQTAAVGVRCRQAYRLSGMLIRDSMWHLDGQRALNGTRKLNASITKEEL